MKVILLCGSPRPSGNTYQVLEECAGVIEDHGLEVEIIPFVGKKIESMHRLREMWGSGRMQYQR